MPIHAGSSLAARRRGFSDVHVAGSLAGRRAAAGEPSVNPSCDSRRHSFECCDLCISCYILGPESACVTTYDGVPTPCPLIHQFAMRG